MDLLLFRRRRSLPFFLLLLLLSASDCFQTRAEVISLTEETFADKVPLRVVKEKDTVWFVKFCVPWCKHCKNLGTSWEDLGKVMEGDDEIEIGEVNCSTNKPVCSKVGIHSYPTFKIFYDGEEISEYRGPREVESLKQFVLDEVDKAARAKLEDV